MATSQQRQQLAKKRKKEEQQLAKLRKTIVRHYTKPHWLEKILADGVIKTEGSNLTSKEPNYKSLMLQYRLIGRYVWFTEDTADSVVIQQREVGITSADLPFFEFNAANIKIERWPDVRKRLAGTALLFAKILDDAATANGDNPNKWWVSKRPVSLEKMIRVVRGTAAADKMMNPYESIFKEDK